MLKMTKGKNITWLLLSLFLVLLSRDGLAMPAEQKTFFDAYMQADSVKEYIWLTGNRKAKSKEILGHKYPKIRVPFWRDASGRTFWVLEEIGKEKPITIGIVIENSKIQALRILKFRESRGWEVKLPSFTSQFDRVAYKDGYLTSNIDGISGATLSVRAVKAIAKLALFLNQQI